MVFREVSVIEIREVLRSWLAGAGLRTVAAQAGVDRKTARRYVEAAVAAGLARDGGPGQLSDELVGQVAEAVRPVRPGGHGQGRDRLETCRAQIQAWVKQDLTVVKIGVLLERQGVVVPYRTLHRFCAERCGYGRSAATTVRVADGEPGMECQLDFGYLVGFRNSAIGPDLGIYAARWYSLMRPPRTGRRLICCWERSAAGWSGRGGRSLRVPITLSPYATWEYSWIRPPSRSRRRTRIPVTSAGGSARPAGGFCCNDRCGR